MELLLRDIAQRALIDPAMSKLLDAICKTKEISLPEALKAQSIGGLQALSRSLTNPSISIAIEEFKSSSKYDKPTWIGLKKLELMIGEKRLMELTPKKITLMCFELERTGLGRNTVCRQFKRAVSKLLRYHLGNAERNRIFSEVNYSAVDDTRKIHLSPSDLKRIFDTCEQLGYHELSVIIRTALQTSADRGVLLAGKATNSNKAKNHRGLLCSDIKIFHDAETGRYEGTVTLFDGKNDSRDRTVPITDFLCRELMVLGKDKKPDTPIFNTTYQQLDFIWKQLRKAAGFWKEGEGYTLRFKDLRAQTSQYGAMVGIPQQVLASTYGHTGEKMVRRYQRYNAAMSMEQAIALEEKMFGRTGS